MNNNWDFMLSFAISGTITVFIIIIGLIGVLWLINQVVIAINKSKLDHKNIQSSKDVSGGGDQ